MSSEALLPCPFCGGTNLGYRLDDIEGWVAYVECHDCDDMTGPMSEFKYQDKDEAKADARERWNRRSASPSIGRVGGDAARALGLLAAEDERNDKIHDLLETIREQIRLEVAPEHRPDGLMKNIQNAVYAMRGRMRLMNDAAITSPLSSLVSHEEPAGDTQGARRVTDETQPAIWVSAAQLAEHVDSDPRDGSEGGNYLPARKTAAEVDDALAVSEAKVAELQEALKPFAKAADVKLCGEWRDDERFGHTDITFHLTFGDLRAARRALEQSK